jgi:SEC-C motif-containing protein
MRSRYSAYALGLTDYIIHTTHPKNPSSSLPFDRWKQEILAFSKNTLFEGLTIGECVDGKDDAFVTFFALLRQGGTDVSFAEKSHFEKMSGQWLYVDGDIFPYTRPYRKKL